MTLGRYRAPTLQGSRSSGANFGVPVMEWSVLDLSRGWVEVFWSRALFCCENQKQEESHWVDFLGGFKGSLNSPYHGTGIFTHILVDFYGKLGGGNSNIVGIFTPKIGEDEPNLSSIFFRWVVQPPSSFGCLCVEKSIAKKEALWGLGWFFLKKTVFLENSRCDVHFHRLWNPEKQQSSCLKKWYTMFSRWCLFFWVGLMVILLG